MSTQSEDGEQGLFNPEWKNQQEKTFTAWCNSHLSKVNTQIKSIADFKDGSKLLKLIEVISGEKLPKPNAGKLRLHYILNINNALDFLMSKGVHLTISAEDIADGNLKLTLGMIWMLIHRFTIQEINFEKGAAKEGLLNWFNEDNEFKVKNFHDSFKDGLALCGFINKYNPDLLDMKKVVEEEPIHILNLAFELAEKYFGVPRMLDANDMIEKPNDLAVMTYISSFYHALAERGNNIKKDETKFVSETYLIEIAESCPSSCMAYLQKCLEESNLVATLHESKNDHGPTYIAVQTSFEELCIQVRFFFLIGLFVFSCYLCYI